MKVLIVSTNLSHPTDAGNRAAIMGQVHLLELLGCEIHFLFADMSLRKTDDTQMSAYWGDRYHVFHLSFLGKLRRLAIDKIRPLLYNGYWKCDDHYPLGLESFANRLNSKYDYDAVIVQYMRLSKLLPKVSIPRKAIYTHDVFSYKDLRVGAPFYETCDAHQEAKALQRCPFIFAIQEEEATYYQYLSPHSRIFTVYSHFEFHEQEPTHNKTILFLASRMDFNINGINWFLENVWPLFIQIEPESKLLIAGTVCENINNKNLKNVTLLGKVESLYSFYQQGDIVINPVFQGTGLKIKTFEALSFGKTTIVHPHSTAGIYQRDKAPLLIASKPEEWIKILSEVFAGKISVVKQKELTRQYICNMNSHIQEQYKQFLQ